MSPSGPGDMPGAYSSQPSDGPDGLIPPPHLPSPTGPHRPRSANSVHLRPSDNEFPVLPPPPGPPPFAPLPIGADIPQRPLSRSRSQKSDQASQDVFHNISNIDALRSGGGGGGGSSSAQGGGGKSVVDSKGGKVTSFGVGPTIAVQSPTQHAVAPGVGVHRGDSAALSRTSAGPRTTLSNTQNGYTHAPRPPSSLGTARSHDGSGSSFALTPESHPLTGLPYGPGADVNAGLWGDREGVVVVPRGNGIGRNRVGVGRGAAVDPRQLALQSAEADFARGEYGRSDSGRDSGRDSGAGSSLDEGPKTPATNLRMTLATPGTEGTVGRDLKGVQAKECAAVPTMHLAVLMM